MGRFSRTYLREGGTRPLDLIIDELIMLFGKEIIGKKNP